MRHGGLVGLLILGLIGCTPGKPIVQGMPEADIFVLEGQIVVSGGPTPPPTQSNPTLLPTARPVETPYTPFALQVAVSSDFTTLNVAPPSGQAVTYRCTAKVSALVTMSNGCRNQDVIWESSDPALAVVDSLGGVRAVGTRAGMVQISAISRDGMASGSVTLQVTNLGDAELVVD